MLRHSFSGFGEQLDHAQNFGLTYLWEDGQVTSTLPNPYFHFVFDSSYPPKHTHTIHMVKSNCTNSTHAAVIMPKSNLKACQLQPSTSKDTNY